MEQGRTGSLGLAEQAITHMMNKEGAIQHRELYSTICDKS